MTPLQRGILFETLLDGTRKCTSASLAAVFQGTWKPALWRQTWDVLTLRHEMLRTEVVWEGVPVPEWRIRPVGSALWREYDWSNLDACERAERWQALISSSEYPSISQDRGAHVPTMVLTWLVCSASEFRLVFHFSPILLDHPSCLALLREACLLYAAIAGGAAIPEMEHVDYGSFARWQTEGDGVASREYWDAYARRFESGTALNLPSEKLSQGGRQQICVEIPQAGCEEKACDWHVLAHAAWALLLHRYTREDQVVFGSWRNGRFNNTAGPSKPCIGLLGNVVPDCQTIDPSMPVNQYLQQVENDYRSGCSHDRAAWQDTGRGRQLAGRHFNFDTVLSVEDAEESTWLNRTYGGVKVLQYETCFGWPFSLMVMVSCGSQHTVRASYDSSRHDRSAVERLLGHFVALIVELVRRPLAALGELDMVNCEESQVLLKTWNPKPLQNYDVACLHDLFGQQVVRTPQATAITSGTERWTYEELDRRSNQVAHYLRELGVGPEVLVGVCLKRTAWLPAAILAILKAGGAYVPMDPSYPADRRAYILNDSRAAVLLVDRENVAQVSETAPQVVVLDEIVDQLAQQPIVPPLPATRPDHLAYVIYTSGSTGRPKGVMVEHRHVVRLMRATEAWYHFDEKDVWTLFHSSAFDFSVWEMWGALLYGGRLVVVPFEITRTPEAFVDLLSREKVTVLNQTPSAFNQWAHAEAISRRNLALRYIIFGGEALELYGLRSWFESHGDVTPLLVNMYGITETTVHVTFRPIRKSDVQLKAKSVVGVPLPDLRVYLLDRAMRPVPIGVPGEICVGGAGVARGYLNRRELTAEKFVADPYSPLPNARMYRSGDLARFWPNGEMEYLGRLDYQVKIRGFRVELGEIESVLARHPDIHSPLVLLHGHDGEQRLVAYMVSRRPSPPSIADLRRFMSQKLPDYMLPSAFVFLDNIPLTANGKVDKKALPMPSDNRPDLGNGMVPPRTSMEISLATLWQEVLGVRNPGVFDNFFDLGGNSFSLAQVHARLQADLGCDLSITALFQYPTIASLAAYLEDGGNGTPCWAGRVKERTLRQQQSAIRFKRVNILKS